jgi:hypothetical protein
MFRVLGVVIVSESEEHAGYGFGSAIRYSGGYQVLFESMIRKLCECKAQH